MTTTLYPPATRPVRQPTVPVHPTTFVDTLKAEWTKLRTLRSSWYTVGGAVVASIGLAALISVAQVSRWDQMTAKERLAFDPTSTALIGVLFAAVIIGMLAVRSMTSEYSTGMIRVTFSAIPGRKGVLAAKAVILAAIAFPVALAVNFVSFFAAGQILASKHVSLSLGQPGVLRAIVFGALAVSAVTLIGLGLGGIIRRTAGATTALMLGTIGSQIFGIALPATARQYLPGAAIQAVTTTQHSSGVLSPAMGLAVIAGYALVIVVIAARLISSRDA